MLLGYEDCRKQAQALATNLAMHYGEVAIHHFPDGESRVTLPSPLPEHLVVYRSLDRPNDKLVELLFTARTARQSGTSRISLIAPYLCYMRQDTAFHPGEAVSQTIVGDFLAGLFDDVVTVDPHLHRIQSLREAVPLNTSIAISAGPAMSDFLRQLGNPVLLGPDGESLQWVAGIASACGLEYGVASKKRHGDRQVSIQLPDMALKGRYVVLVDDVVSSGETVAMATAQCLQAGAVKVDVLVTHALFAPGSEQRMRQAGVEQIWSTDSITHTSNRIPLAGLLSDAIEKLV